MSSNENQENNYYNPLFTGKKIMKDENDNSIILSQSIIPKYFNEIYILCLLNIDDKRIVDLYYPYVKKDLYEELSNNLILYRCNINICKNENHFDKMSLFSSDKLNRFNKFNYELDDVVLVLPILNMNLISVIDYIKLYKSSTLKEVYNLIFLSNYNSQNLNNIFTNNQIEKSIKNMDEAEYWTYSINCKLNLMSLYNKQNKKRFRFDEFRSNTNNLLENFKEDKLGGNTIDNTNKTKKIEEVNYMQFIFKESKTQNFRDISKIVKYYDIPILRNNCNKFNFTYEDILKLFKSLNEKTSILLYCYLLISPDYTSLILKNKKLLIEMEDNRRKYAGLFRYLEGYSFKYLYYKECLDKNNLTENHQSVIDLETAMLYNVYPFLPYLSPHCPLNVSEKIMSNNNLCGFPSYNNKTLRHGGLVDTNGWIRRFNVFCTNNSKINLFENVDFEKHKIGITGSVITACSLKRPIQLALWENIGYSTFDSLWTRYFSEYYCSTNNKVSDLDIMVETDCYLKFFDTCHYIHNNLVVNILNNNVHAEARHIHCNIEKSVVLYLSIDYIRDIICSSFTIKDELKDKFDNNLPYEILCSNLKLDCVIKLFMPLIKKNHDRFISEKFKDYTKEELDKIKEKYPIYFDFSEENKYIIYLNDKGSFNTVNNVKSKYNLSENDIIKLLSYYKNNMKNVNDKNLGISLGFKCKIRSVYMNHDFEIYKVKSRMICALHHLAQVRGYFNGSKVLLCTSCIMSLLTYISPDLRWHSSNSNIWDIVLKYRSRGFGIYLSDHQINSLIEFVSNSDYWKSLYRISSSDSLKQKKKKILGFLMINSPVLRPRQICIDWYDNANYVDLTNGYDDKYCINKVCKYISNSYEYFEVLEKKNLDNKLFIDPITGYSNPLDLSVIDYFLNNFKEFNNERVDGLAGCGGRI